ncbi:MAG: DM13 domain-containing protein [Colwelliaceae bacterium]|jgi:hypothetical protein|nr:DM13 domain-containing protein [Colwelliaceae bacterium]
MTFKQIISIFLSFALFACGGGSGSSSTNNTSTTTPVVTPPPATFTGVFVDSAVEGLQYQTATNEGMTNIDGEFIYQADEEITFSIGDIIFPAVVANSVLTPLDILKTTDINDPAVINMLRLLQSLDFDGDTDNGIQINQTAHDAAQNLDIDFSDADFDEQVVDLLFNNGGFYQELLSAEMAVYHFQLTLNALNNQGISTCDKTHSSVGYFGYFETLAHGVSGRAEIIDDCTIKVTEFYYDGQGPDVFFYAAIDHKYAESDAFAISQAIQGPAYENAEFVLRLPNGKTLDDLNSLSVWCVDFDANFGQLLFTP